MKHLRIHDQEVFRIVEAEKERIENTIDLIAAENHAPLSGRTTINGVRMRVRTVKDAEDVSTQQRSRCR